MGWARSLRVPNHRKIPRYWNTGSVCCRPRFLVMIVSRTPFRISFFGGGTDYPAWYREHGGAVLAASIDKYCYLTCRYLPPFFEHRIRVVYRKIETCRSVDEVSHPTVRETLRFLRIDRG